MDDDKHQNRPLRREGFQLGGQGATCNYDPEEQPAFRDDTLQQFRANAERHQTHEGARLAKDHALLRPEVTRAELTVGARARMTAVVTAWQEAIADFDYLKKNYPRRRPKIVRRAKQLKTPIKWDKRSIGKLMRQHQERKR